MPVVFIFLGLTFITVLFYGKIRVLSLNKYFLLGILLVSLLSYFVKPLLVTENLQINAPLFFCFVFLIISLSLTYPHDLIRKSLIANMFILFFYILLVKIDGFYLLSFNILPVVVLVILSNIIIFKSFEQIFLNSVLAFFIIESYTAFYLLHHLSFASIFLPTIIYPFAISLSISFLIIAFLQTIKIYTRRLKCEN